MTFSNAWTGTTPYVLDKDWAIVWIGHDVNLGYPEVMHFTNAPNAFVLSNDDHLRGYPVYDDDVACTLNQITDDCETIEDSLPGRSLWSVEDGAASAYGAGFVKWLTSFAAGMSGAPHVICPNGDCASGGRAITGIQAATMNMCGGSSPCATGFAVGPDAKAFKQAVNNVLSNRPSPGPEVDCPYADESTFVVPVLGQDVFQLDPANFSPSCQAGGLAVNTSICGDTLVYTPNGPGGCKARDGKALVYLPGTGSSPAENAFVTDMAWHADYRTIGLSYSNREDAADWCINRTINAIPGTDPAIECKSNPADFRDECLFFTRKEKITGEDPFNQTTFEVGDPVVPFDYHYFDPFPVEDSVVFRLVFAFLWAEDNDVRADGNDDCGWGDFIDPDIVKIPIGGDFEDFFFVGDPMAGVNWEMIVLGGWSQGSATSTLIALENEVAGLFLLEGPSDMCLTDVTIPTSGIPSTYISELVDAPIQEPSGGSPRFGIWHEDSNKPNGALDARPTLWDNDYPLHDGPLAGLRMAECEDQDWDASTDSEGASGAGIPPLRFKDFSPMSGGIEGFRGMAIFTDQVPAPGCDAHGSVAISENGGGVNQRVCMPTDATSGIAATNAGETNVFEAYVQAFCALDMD